MKDMDKTKEELVKELEEMRQRVSELEAAEFERRRAEEALRESEERYRQMADNSLMGMFIQEYGPFSYVNDRLAQMLGYRPKEMVGRHVLDFVHPDDRELVYSKRVKRIHGRDVPRSGCKTS